jgi:hypothetical protein
MGIPSGTIKQILVCRSYYVSVKKNKKYEGQSVLCGDTHPHKCLQFKMQDMIELKIIHSINKRCGL